MNNRINNLRKSFSDIDALLVSDPKNIYYLSGFTSGEDALLLVTYDREFIITDFRYIDQVEIQSPKWELVLNNDGVYSCAINLAIKSNIKNLGFEDERTLYSQYTKMIEVIKLENSKLDLIPKKELVEEIRLVKTEDEVNNIRQAASIADKAFEHILKYIKEGIAEKELAFELEFFMRRMGAQGLSFETIVASGKRSAMPHGVASDKKIEIGDFITFDFGCVYNNYCSDMTRTVVLGEASEKQKKIYNIVLEANEAVLKELKPGVMTKQMDSIAREIIKQKGYGENFGHGLGHGVGLYIHEAPTLSIRNSSVLKSGMIVTDEPGIYISGFGGVRIEDLVHITDNGREVLSASTKELLII